MGKTFKITTVIWYDIRYGSHLLLYQAILLNVFGFHFDMVIVFEMWINFTVWCLLGKIASRFLCNTFLTVLLMYDDVCNR